MYAEQTKTGYNLMELNDTELGLVEFGLSLIPINANEHNNAQKLWNRIDDELKDTKNS